MNFIHYSQSEINIIIPHRSVDSLAYIDRQISKSNLTPLETLHEPTFTKAPERDGKFLVKCTCKALNHRHVLQTYSCKPTFTKAPQERWTISFQMHQQSSQSQTCPADKSCISWPSRLTAGRRAPIMCCKPCDPPIPASYQASRPSDLRAICPGQRAPPFW